jgi:hypothetical protein
MALLLLATAASLALVGRREVVLADLLFQSPSTNTPDPNSPQATPTATATSLATNTPTPTATTTPSASPSATPSATPTAVLLPTDTPFVPATATPVALPTDAPLVLPTDTPFLLPTDTPFAPVIEPVFGSPLDTPTPIAAGAAPPILPPAALAPSLSLSQPMTAPLETLITGAMAAQEKAPVEAQPARRRLDPALFIDNLVIAFGYVWMCFGLLALAGAALGGVFLWRRRRQPPAQPVPDPGQPAAVRPAAPPAQQPPEQQPPAPTRVAARRSSPPPQDLD